MNRCYTISDRARKNGPIWHLPDGPEQRARDELMKNSQQSNTSSVGCDSVNPNKWSDPKFQPWMFGFDTTQDV